MTKVSFESNVSKSIEVDVVGVEVTPVEKKQDSRQSLWDELDELEVDYKKNMSKSKLEELLK